MTRSAFAAEDQEMSVEDNGSVASLPVRGQAIREPAKVGDQLWYVPNNTRWHEPHWVTVTGVGRRWLNTDRLRFDKNTLAADGGAYSSPGRAYRTREEWAESVYLDRAWGHVTLYVRNTYVRPRTLLRTQIEAIAAILGVALPPEVAPQGASQHGDSLSAEGRQQACGASESSDHNKGP